MKKFLTFICIVIILCFIGFMFWMFIPKFGIKVYYCENGTTFSFKDNGKACIMGDKEYGVKYKMMSRFDKKKTNEEFYTLIDENNKKIIFMGDNISGNHNYFREMELREATKKASKVVENERNCVLYGNCDNNEPSLSNRYDY